MEKSGENLRNASKSYLFSDEAFEELFSLSPFQHEKSRMALESLANDYKCKTEWNRMYNAYKKELSDKKRTMAVRDGSQAFGREQFDDPELACDLRCGSWNVSSDGIFAFSDKGEIRASNHPIYPARVLVNAEDGTQKVVLRFKVRGRWRETVADKSVIASNNKIIALADRGIQVNSENAKALVKFLADVESLNPNDIVEKASTSRLGWLRDSFVPYDDEIGFDDVENFAPLFNSIREHGSRSAWISTMMEIRKKRFHEIGIYCAASLASVLVEPCGTNPFIVSLWGGTGRGKTVALMLATSIWADPSEGTYMTDAKATGTAMEVRLNTLNSLPMTLDDMAQVREQYGNDFSSLVYRWCAGKGKDRSNQNLGINRPMHWRNCTLTNGEESLVKATMQGGAINRIIDVELKRNLFTDGNQVANTLRQNYGFIGKEFVRIIQGMDRLSLVEMMDDYKERIIVNASSRGLAIPDKQILPMALIMLADEISEREIYRDGIRLSLNDCVDCLKTMDDISEGKRGYEFIVNEIAVNRIKFATETNEDPGAGYECWGRFEAGGYVAINGNIFESMMQRAGFQSGAFLSWAADNGLLIVDKHGKGRKPLRRLGSVSMRCVVLKLPEEEFESVSAPEETPF